MKQKLTYLFLLALLIGQATVKGQQLGFDFPEGVQKVRIEFEQHNNLIVIPILVNGTIELKFILDTGVQYPILTEKFFADILGFDYARRIVVQGPGINDSISAMVARDVTLELPGGVTSGINQYFLVLEHDFLKLRENMGTDVYGIIGYDIFSRFTVEVNYEEKYLTLYEPRKFHPKRKYKKVPMNIVNTKPYMEVVVNKDEEDEKKLRLMIDSGASHSLLLNDGGEESFLPDKNVPSVIGRGLGGEIYGRMGRLSKISVSRFELEQPIVSFPLKGDYGSIAMKGSRNGTIGGEFLSRFNVVFDYFHGNIYLKKNRYFSRDFEHDMSGMNLVAYGREFDRYKVGDVRYGSPAYEAGIRSGDVILSINGYSYESIKLAGAIALLRNKPGKKITVRVQEGKKSVKKSFRLERFI